MVIVLNIMKKKHPECLVLWYGGKKKTFIPKFQENLEILEVWKGTDIYRDRQEDDSIVQLVRM